MGYKESLEKAGAIVHAYKEIGSYQGTWGAIVEFKGKKSLVTGSFGSCSVCDAFKAEFGYGKNIHERDGKYYDDYWDEISKEEFDLKTEAYNKKLADFGASYLNTLQDQQDIENRIKGFNEEDWFDREEKQLYDWALTHLK